MKRYLHFVAAYALRAFGLSLLIPIWTAYYFSSWEITGKITWFPIMLDSFFRAAERENAQTLFDIYGENLVKLAVVLLAGAAMGHYKARRAVRQR
jgi:hypothetical protein